MHIHHTMTPEEIASVLATDLDKGLTQSAHDTRLSEDGENVLAEAKRRPLVLRFIDQIKDFMILVLMLAALISFITGEAAEGFLIIGIVLMNAILGLVQEERAEQALRSIKKMTSPSAKVIRDGIRTTVDVKTLVRGDVVVLEAGDFVPADVRIIESVNLKTDESALTGEALPVDKTTDVLEQDDLPLGDRTNSGYMGTVVTYGRGVAVVVSTGMETELGKIATMLSETEDEMTPLQESLSELGKILAMVALAITTLIFAITIIEAYVLEGGASFDVWKEAFLTSVALAVAAIPEGLPAIITVVLAIGMQRLVRQKAIVRTLPAVETLGSTKIICSDKTGTLTQNLMTVTAAFIKERTVKVEKGMDAADDLRRMSAYGVLCNDVSLTHDDDKLVKVGDPTEIAFIDLALSAGLDPEDVRANHPRLFELPFDSSRKMMTTVHDFEDGRYAIVKGAPDVLFSKSVSVHGGNNDLDPFKRANREMASKALRVLAVAYKKIEPSVNLKSLSFDDLENDLVLMGLVGMIDPARPEVRDAIALCDRAGIKTVMITGDHLDTAVAIAKDLAILKDGDEAVSGAELDAMDDETFKERFPSIRVYARVSPANKVRIVEAWRDSGNVVAMTGDGVNDAPSLKKADIGIAMGITGTEVAKGAADMVLTDDNFETIVTAVSEGRAIFANIKKAIHFLLSCNIGEIITIFLGTTLGILVFSGRVTTLTAVQILWVNLVTDSLMAIALGMEPKDKDIMNEAPRDTRKSIFAGGLGKTVAIQGTILGLLSFSAYVIGWFIAGDVSRVAKMENAQTMTFIVLALSQLVHAFNVRHQTKSVFSIPGNRMLIYALLASLLLMAGVIIFPFTRALFGINMPSLAEWAIILALVSVPLVLVETYKLVMRHRHV
jgi:P-type Ca2+ transporter type 2C